MKNRLNDPKVSVILPTYNSISYLERAVISVKKQSYTNWELIIINDASIDDTSNRINKIIKNDKRIKYHTNENNIGFVQSLNKGIKLATGKFIARIDSDDIWIDETKLDKQIDYLLNNPDIILLGSWGYKIDSLDKRTAYLKYPVNDDSIKNYLCLENCFIHSSVIFKKDTILKFGGYEDEYKSAEDYALWLKLGLHGKFQNIPEYLTGYRTNYTGMSLTGYQSQITNTIKALKKYGKSYKYFLPSLALWYLRKILPRGLREFLSGFVRDKIV